MPAPIRAKLGGASSEQRFNAPGIGKLLSREMRLPTTRGADIGKALETQQLLGDPLRRNADEADIPIHNADRGRFRRRLRRDLPGVRPKKPHRSRERHSSQQHPPAERSRVWSGHDRFLAQSHVEQSTATIQHRGFPLTATYNDDLRP